MQIVVTWTEAHRYSASSSGMAFNFCVPDTAADYLESTQSRDRRAP
jgi:hypothetical protein